jgi:hypothetical protein
MKKKTIHHPILFSSSKSGHRDLTIEQWNDQYGRDRSCLFLYIQKVIHNFIFNYP